MKRRNRGILAILLVILMVLQVVPVVERQDTAEAATTSKPKFKLLEIVDQTGKQSQISSDLKSKYNLEVTTMPMKKFVAQRDELDGMYDGIAIMEGKYTSKGVQEKEHNTTAVMNDITNLKAKEIIDDYVNKGLLVLLHKESIATGDKLKANFTSDLIQNNKSNIFTFENDNEIYRGSMLFPWGDLFEVEDLAVWNSYTQWDWSFYWDYVDIWKYKGKWEEWNYYYNRFNNNSDYYREAMNKWDDRDNNGNNKNNKNNWEKLYKSYNNNESKNKEIWRDWKRWYDWNNSNKESVSLSGALEAFFLSDYRQRPRMDLFEKPSAPKYEENGEISEGSPEFSSGDSIGFKFNTITERDSRNLKAVLSIDLDFNDRYETSEIVAEKKVTGSETTISYQLPSGYSGIRNWKLELIDNATGLKDYKTGTIKFIDQQVNINVLQVMADDDGSSLTNDENMDPGLLYKAGEYKINITTKKMSEFKNPSMADLNGKFDMIIFGFRDEYNVRSTLTETAAKTVEEFIKSGQSVMFTHDTIFLKNEQNEMDNKWVNYFMDDTAQKIPKTNLGYNAPNQSTLATNINDGLVTSYPFSLNGDITIASTHNQYFTLDLEQEDVTPWYNIKGSNRDINDSYNHYYMYSKGNVTYSGTGHTSASFPEQEQKLFVNTMFRAYLGSNHAPEITVNKPKEDDVTPTHQKIELSYDIDDLDMKDRLLSTKVFLIDENTKLEKEVHSQVGVPNGQTVVTSIEHGLIESGEVTLKIEATDSRQAKGEKIIKVKVGKITTPLEVTRSTEASNPTEVDKEVTIHYKITPKEIKLDENTQQVGNSFILKDVEFIEMFPLNLEVVAEEREGNLENGGYKIERSLEDIVYTRVNEGSNKFAAQPIEFSIQVKPKKKQNYNLATAKIAYEELDGKMSEAAFNHLTIVADVPLEKIEFPTKYVESINANKNFTLDLKYLPENAGIKQVIWSEDSEGSILELNADDGTAVMKKEGTAIVIVKVIDVFGNEKTASATVTVRVFVEGIQGDDVELYVGETKPLVVRVTPESAKSSLEFEMADSNIATLNKSTYDTYEVTGKEAGETTVTVSGIKANGDIIQKVIKVTIKDREVTVTPNAIMLKVGETFSDWSIGYKPDIKPYPILTWKSEKEDIATINDNDKVVAVAKGETDINITPSFGILQGKIKVTVIDPKISTESLTLKKGEIGTIKVKFQDLDATNAKKYEYAVANPYYAEVDSDGKITAREVGKTTITTTVTMKNEEKYTATMTVTITGTDIENNKNKY